MANTQLFITIAKEAGGVCTEIDEFLSQSRLVAQSIMGKSIWRTPPSSNTGLRIEFKWVLHLYNLYNCMFCTDMAAVCLIFFVLGLAPGVVLGEPTLPFCPCPSLPEVAFIWPEKCMAADFGSPETPVLHPPRVSELDDESLDRALDILRYSDAHMAVLFHASWCPFSKSCRSLFDDLSSMFPVIYHVAVEESVVMPSVLSRNGVHSFPSLFLQNRTSRVRYHGSRDLDSLVHFYKKNTGIEPIYRHPLAKEFNGFRRPFRNEGGQVKEHSPCQWEMSPKNLLQREPYLVFAVLFLVLRMLVYLFRKVLLQVKRCRLRRIWHVNLALLSENTRPFLKHALHMLSLNRIWCHLKFSKTRNFQEGAKNARIWASLASVFLGKRSVNRPGSSSEIH